MATVRVTAYGRVKPCPPQVISQDIKIESGPRDSKVIFTNQNMKQESFRFKKIFDENSTQVEIFEIVGKPLIENTLKGYNSTILSYGQTGTGKTYTMTGEFHDQEYQGLIPRSIAEIFSNMKPSTEITISYFEIYNEHVFDLIKNDDQSYFEISETGPLSNTQSLAFRNLSRYKVSTVDKAMALLIQGESKKMLAQTSSNERSSRSHTIFAIGLKFPNSNGTYMNPVLLLVDLAGSENLSKCKGNHNFFETRYINLSLHYLEQVLLALRRPKRVHVPYRNSLMTTFLRNSLGGSCITAVIATFSISEEDIQETRQTCRFAVNVAYIKNELKVNEDLNCTKKLEDLEREVELLRAQLHMVTKGEASVMLSIEDKELCIKEVQKFIREGFSICLPLKDPKKVQFCFHLLRKKILKMARRDNEEKHKPKEIFSADGNARQPHMLPIKSAAEIAGEKNWRNQKQPLDLPKVNIMYGNFENATDMENGPSKKPSKFKITESESILLEAAKGSKTQPRIPVKTMVTNFEPIDVKDCEPAELSAEQSFISATGIPSELMDHQESQNSVKKSPFSGRFSLIEEKEEEEKEKQEEVEIEEDKEEKQLLGRTVSTERISSEEILKKEDFDGECEQEESTENSRDSEKGDSVESSDKEKLSESEDESDEDLSSDETEDSEDEIEIDEGTGVLNLCDIQNTDSTVSALPLTGDQDVDEEIIKFYKSRYDHFKDI